MTRLPACTRWALPPLLLAAIALAAPAASAVPSSPAPSAPVASTPPPSNAPPPVELKLPADIVYEHRGSLDSAVVFSHQSHVTPGENACLQCHNGAYPMLKRGPVPRHGTMNAGGSCGACHDGKHAFGVKDAAACGSCHAGVQPAAASVASAPGKGGALTGAAAGAGAAAPAVKLPKAHLYPQGDGSPGAVTFRHKTHVKDPVKDCASCHPKPFRKVAAAPLPNGGMHDPAGCGSCHDGKKSFATDDDGKCARCHRETGGQP